MTRSLPFFCIWIACALFAAACTATGTRNPDTETTSTTVASAAAPARDIPWAGEHLSDADLKAFVPEGSIVRMEQHGDLDGDGDDDVLLVLQRTTGEEPQFKPRTLLVLRRDATGRLEKVLENPDAILCLSCGGMMGDPLQWIRIVPGAFSIRFEGGSRQLWALEFRFVYAKQNNNWLLSSVNDSALDRLDGRSGQHQRSHKDFGVIRFDEFNIEDHRSNALP